MTNYLILLWGSRMNCLASWCLFQSQETQLRKPADTERGVRCSNGEETLKEKNVFQIQSWFLSSSSEYLANCLQEFKVLRQPLVPAGIPHSQDRQKSKCSFLEAELWGVALCSAWPMLGRRMHTTAQNSLQAFRYFKKSNNNVTWGAVAGLNPILG